MITWDFAGKVVVITGGTGGLGLALCRAFAQSGAHVSACGLLNEQGNSGLDALARTTGKGTLQIDHVDLRRIPDLQQWMSQVHAERGGVDILVNAAGVSPVQALEEVTEDSWDQVMDINLKSLFFATQAVIPGMVQRGGGAIVQISSIAAYNGGIIPAPAYGASKAGIHALTKWFAGRYSKDGIRTNMVAPGPFQTEMIAGFPDEQLARMRAATPNGRLGTPDDVVQAVLFLADEASGHMTGAALDVCGGVHMR